MNFINSLCIAKFNDPFSNFILFDLLAEFGTSYQSPLKIFSPSGVQKPCTPDFVQRDWNSFLVYWEKNVGEIQGSVLEHLHFTDFLGDISH